MSNYTRTNESFNGSEYVSVNGFKKSRRKNNLKELLYFYLDIDVKKTPIFESILLCLEEECKGDFNKIQKEIEKKYIELILEKCEELKLEKPTMINNSGNGFHVYWKIKSYSKADYFEEFYGASANQQQAYTLIEKKLVKHFRNLGADPKATDSTRLLRKAGSFNQKSLTFCEEIYNSDTEVKFEDFANKLLKYTYKEVEKHRKITKKQVEFLLNNKIATELEIEKMDKKQAINHISTFINNERGKITKENYKNNYIENLLNRLFADQQIAPGNRAYFFFYMAIAYKRKKIDINEALNRLETKYNIKLNFPQTELIKIVESAYRKEVSCNISKLRILGDLGIENEQKYLRKKIKRSTKAKSNNALTVLRKNYHKYRFYSARKLAAKINISKSTIAKYKHQIEREIKEKIIEQRNMYANFIREMEEYSDFKLQIRTIPNQEKECPQKE